MSTPPQTDPDTGVHDGRHEQGGPETRTVTRVEMLNQIRASRQRPVVPPPGPVNDGSAGVAVGIIAAGLSVAATWYYFAHNLILGYPDSFSHLEISRRVVTGLSPGIGQLGGVWLPVPQLLQALLGWNFWLYRTGLAGAVVSMVCYVASTVMIYRLILLFCGYQAVAQPSAGAFLQRRSAPAVAGALVYATNVNVLYQQSTPMDELPFYLFTIVAIYYLVKWGQSRQPRHLLPASIASMLAMLCRYEGWFLACIYVLCVIAMALRWKYSWRDARGLTLATALFGLLIPAAGWIAYNSAIFGNPLNFLSGHDAKAAQLTVRHSDVNVGSWPLTLRAYEIAVGSDVGLVILALAAVGIVVFLAVERFSTRSMPVFALLAVIPFYLLTLERGDEPISLPYQGYLNGYRFGLAVIIPAAILIGYLVSKVPAALVLTVAVIVAVAAATLSDLSFVRHQVVLATEAAQELRAQQAQAAAGNFLEYRTTGLILMSDMQNQRVAFDVVDRELYDGTRESGKNQWVSLLKNPEGYGVRVIVMRLPGPAYLPDVVYTDLHDSPALKPYRLVYRSSGYLIYSLPSGS